MALRFLANKSGIEQSDIPKKFTVSMGKLIKKARLEAGMSQVELAKEANFRQASISEIENGKREVTSSELVYFCYALNKPIIYFFPEFVQSDLNQRDLAPLLQELLLISKKLGDDDLKRLVVQAKALVELENTR
jgi:transcriptional regulator with XRE-family HTH domain